MQALRAWCPVGIIFRQKKLYKIVQKIQNREIAQTMPKYGKKWYFPQMWTGKSYPQLKMPEIGQNRSYTRSYPHYPHDLG